MSLRRWFGLGVLLLLGYGLASVPREAWVLGRYWVSPDYPRFEAGSKLALAGLTQPVRVQPYADGRYRIEAQNGNDLYRAVGYLQASDRMFQMDLMRHIAAGRLAELVGNVAFGPSNTLDSDRFNRFMGFADQAKQLLEAADDEHRGYLEAFAAGVNAWLATGPRSLEHRLLDVEPEAWTPLDSLVIFRLLSFGLTHNYSREVRRLRVACEASIDAAERIWPSDIEYDEMFLPPEAIGAEEYPVPPSIVPEMRAELAGLCPSQAPPQPRSESPRAPSAVHSALATLALFRHGLAASNNWAVTGAKSASGGAMLANDPHLPHMNPPLPWGLHIVLPDREAVGFTIVGLPFVVFGHNGTVAWGATTNNVDLQDLYVIKESNDVPSSYEYDGQLRPYVLRTEKFLVRHAAPVEVTVRYTHHGPLLNDVEVPLSNRIPATAIRSPSVEGALDPAAVAGSLVARTAAEFRIAIGLFDTACQSWVHADTAGDIGFVSPCRVPVRNGWTGTFPVPGWLSKYEWDGWIDKAQLPQAGTPRRGWIATANNQAFKRHNYFTVYNSDASPPTRYRRIADQLEAESGWTIESMARLQADTTLPRWPTLRREALADLCDGPRPDAEAAAQQALCSWDGDLGPDSVGATVYSLWETALLERALPDELEGGADGEPWRYIVSIPLVEANVEWLLRRGADDAVWDDVRTEPVETRADIVAGAFQDAVARGRRWYGDDVAAWRWGKVRPFELRHPIAGASPLLGSLLNAPPLPGRGAPETVFKNQYLRVDRDHMHPGIGPVFRMIVDMANPRTAVFTLAGGQSGWPASPHYADLLPAWMDNAPLAMTPTLAADAPAFTLAPRAP